MKKIVKVLFGVLQGAIIGLGAVLPGISGGVLSVVFGIYKPAMEFLSDPVRRFKTHAKTFSLFSRLCYRIYGCRQYSGFFSGKISGSLHLPFRGSDCGNVSFPLAGGGAAWQKIFFFYLHAYRHTCNFHSSLFTEADLRRNRAGFHMVSVLRILPCAEYHCAGYELFNAPYAYGTLYSLC